jgi:hypothetical protein
MSSDGRYLVRFTYGGSVLTTSCTRQAIGESSESVGSGTDYILTNAFAPISFGTSGALSVTLPDPGTYEIEADIREDISGITAAAQVTQSIYKLYKGTSALTGTERNGTTIPILTGAITTAQVGQTIGVRWIITVTSGCTINLYGMTSGTITGNWVLKSDTNGLTTLKYKRIA